MQYRSKKFLSLLLAVLMIISLLPSAAFADEGEESIEESIEEIIEEPAEDEPAEEPVEEEDPVEEPEEEPEEPEEPVEEPVEESTEESTEGSEEEIVVASVTDGDEEDEGPVEVSTYAALKEALANGKSVKLTADFEFGPVDGSIQDSLQASADNATIDLNDHTITLVCEDLFIESSLTIKNGKIALGTIRATGGSGLLRVGALNGTNENLTVTLDNVTIDQNGYESRYAIFSINASNTLNVTNCNFTLSNDSSSNGGVFKTDSTTGTAILNITKTTMSLTNVRRVALYTTATVTDSTITIQGDGTEKMEHGFNGTTLTVDSSTITMDGLHGRGLTMRDGSSVTVNSGSITITNCAEATIQVQSTAAETPLTVAEGATVTVDAQPNEPDGDSVKAIDVSDVTVDSSAGATKVSSLEELTTALANGKTNIQLTADITANPAFTVSTDDTVIDLNSKTLTLSVATDQINANTTIKNGNITISGTAGPSNGYVQLAPSKNLTFDGVTVSGSGYSANWSVFCTLKDSVMTFKDSTVTLSNDQDTGGGAFKSGSYAEKGTFVFDKTTVALTNACRGFISSSVEVKNGSTVTIKGENNGNADNAFNECDLTVTGSNTSVTVDGVKGRGFSANKEANKLTVSDGATVSFTNCSEGAIMAKDASTTVTVDSDSTLTADTVVCNTGMTITVNDDTTIDANSNSPSLSVQNGAVTVTSAVAKIGSVGYETLAAAINAANDNDTVTIVTAGTYTLPAFSGKTLTIAAAENTEVTFDVASAVTVSSNVTFNNIIFDYYPNNTYVGLQHAGEMTYNNCTFNGQVFLYGTKETFNNCTFNQSSNDAYNVWTYGAKETIFNNCTFNCAGKSVLVYNEGSGGESLTVTDCKFIASEAVSGKAAIEIDTQYMPNGASITVDSNTTVNETFGTGSVSGSSLWNDKNRNLTTAKYGNNITVTVAGDVVLQPIVAKVGDTQYATLDELFADTSLSGDVTVELLRNADVTNAVTFSYTHGVKYNFVTSVTGGVTINFKGNPDTPQNLHKFSIGENVTMNIEWLSVTGADITVSGTLNADYLYLYGTGKGFTITETGVVTVTGNVLYENTEYHTVQVKGGTVLTVNGKLTTKTLNVWTEDQNNSHLIVSGENATVEANWLHAWNGKDGVSSQKVTVENGGSLTITSDSKAMQADRGSVVTVNGGTLTANLQLGRTNGDNGTLTVTNDGVVNGTVTLAGPASKASGTGLTVVSGDSNYQVIESNGIYTLNVPVATIGDQSFTSLQAAFDAAQTGDTITLLRDIELTDSIRLSNVGKETKVNNITLDGDSHTVSMSDKNLNIFKFTQIENLTVKNLNVKGTNVYCGFDLVSCTNTTLDTVNVTGTYEKFHDVPLGVYFHNNGGGALINCQTLVGVFKNGGAYNEGNDQRLKLVNTRVAKLYVNTTTGEYENSVAVYKQDDDTVTRKSSIGILVCGDPTAFRVDSSISVNKKVLNSAKFVAAIGNTGYATLSDAIEAADENDTITLLADVANAGAITLPKGATFEGSGKTLSGDSCIYINAAGGTVNNVKFSNISNGEKKLSAIYASGLTGEATITGCEFDTVDWDAIQITPKANAEIVITDNIFKGNAYRNVHVESAENVDFSATVTGNKMYSGTDSDRTGATDNATCSIDVYYFTDADKVNLSGNYIENPNTLCILSDSGTNVSELALPLKNESLTNDITTYVAMVKGQYTAKLYDSFSNAVAALTSGDTLTLLADVETSSLTTISKDNVTFDGNGHNITRVNNTGSNGGPGTTLYFTGKNPTIRNLTVGKEDTVGEYAIYLNSCGQSTLESVTVIGDYSGLTDYPNVYAVSFANGGGGTLKDCDVPGVFKNGDGGTGKQLTLDNSTIGNMYVNYTEIDNGTIVTAAEDDASSIEKLVLGYGDTSRISDNVTAHANEIVYAVAIRKIGASNVKVYFTLADAVKFAESTDSSTITLLRDAEGSGVVFEQGRHTNLTIDFNGFTYTVTGPSVGSSGSETNAFQILKDNSVTLKNGTLTSTATSESACQRLIQNYADLTLADMELDGTNIRANNVYALSFCSGTVNITGSTSITANEDAVAFDSDKFSSYDVPTVTVDTTGTITGNVCVTGGTLNIENGTFHGKLSYTKGALAISGGLFDHEIKSDWCAAGYAPVALTGGLYGVKTDFAARIGTETYATLAEAFAAAQSGDTIELLKDVELTEGISISKAGVFGSGNSLTINGNGHTISASFEKDDDGDYTDSVLTFATQNLNGTVTIKDLTINANASNAICVTNKASTGNFILENVTVTGDYDDGDTQETNNMYAVSLNGSMKTTFTNCDLAGVTGYNQNNSHHTFTLNNTTVGTLYLNDKFDATLGEGNSIDSLVCESATVSSDIASKVDQVYLCSKDEEGDTVYVTPAAKIGDTLYATLADAVNAEGDNIHLLKNNEESVTVNKALTIIGYDFTATGITAGEGYEKAETTIGGIIHVYSFVEKTEEEKCVAKIGDTEYTTVAAALLAAKSGETVKLVADSNEPEATLLLNEDVTLDLGTYTLTAKALFGVNGSYVTGTVYSATGDYAKLKVNTLKLGETAPTQEKGGTQYNILPIKISDCYAFTLYSVYEVGSSYFKVENGAIELGFSEIMSSTVKTKLANSYSAEANEYQVVVKVTWNNDNGSYNQTYAYNETFVNQVLAADNVYYSFSLAGYDKLGLNDSNMDTLKVQAMIVTDSGVVATGTLHTNTTN